MDKEGNPIKAGKATAVWAADWDSDGDLDLVVGNIEGKVLLVLNEGTDGKPAFGNPTPLQAAGRPIQVAEGDAGPCVADWDGDGRADLLVGSGSGAVVWYRNEGRRGAPELAAARTLVPSGSGRERAGSEGPGRRTKVCVADWNGDGRPDLLVGDLTVSGRSGARGGTHGYVWLFLRQEPREESGEREAGGLRP